MKKLICARAAELGFDDCRVAAAHPPTTADALQRWLASGQHGEMTWLARNAPKRCDPQLVLPSAKSIVVVAASYGDATDTLSMNRNESDTADCCHPHSHLFNQKRGVVARYARHADYHDVFANRLRELCAFMDTLGGGHTRSLWYVDTGPVLEREFAERAGIGFIGKHTNLITRRFGNWILLGEALTTLKLEPDASEKNHCGKCARCLDACPTRAITAPFQLDARRCIAYLTIELKGAIPLELRPAVGNRIFGCDDCLAVCPWNRFAHEGRLMRSFARSDLAQPDFLELLTLDEAAFKRRFAGTPLTRLKLRGLRRNVCVALGNVGDATSLPALQAAASDADALVAEHARWAIEQILSKQ